jgi:hypothetical protein
MQKNKIVTTAALAVALAVSSAVATTGPAEAATQKTTCTDGANRLWEAKASWGSRYVSGDGTTRVRLTYVGWTTKARTLTTQTEITTYQPGGQPLQTLSGDNAYDYTGGTTWFSRNPANPLAGPGSARVTLKVGLHGTSDCSITFTEPSVDSSGALTFPSPPVAVGETTASTSAVTDTSATLTWSAVSGATGYLVGRDGTDASGLGPWSTTEGGTTTSRTFTNLRPETTYQLYVQPVGGVRKSMAVTTAVQSSSSGPTGGVVPTGVPGTWHQAFGDEFSGTSVNTANWNAAYCKTMNKTEIDPANATVGNGVATLRLSGGKGAMLMTSGVDGCAGSSKNFTLPVGGYAEARANFPTTSSGACADWPAWWASGPGWPAAGEHDIAEVLDGTLTGNYHSPSANLRTQTGSASRMCGSWHVYGLHRRAGAADLYWDGVKVATYPTNDNGAGQALILNIGVHSTNTDLTKPLLVDYVRAWSSV